MENSCHFCQNATLTEVLDCGLQPLCNRFLTSPNDVQEFFPMVIGQCSECGLVQLCQPVSPNNLRSRYDWVTYHEPEAHLEDLVAQLAVLPEITTESFVGAVVYGNDSTISHFEKRGFVRTWRLDLRADLSINDPYAGVETIQERLTPESASEIVGQHGQFDLLVVRHMLEHAHDLRQFLEAIKRLVKSAGYVVFEVPDCENPIADCDYSILWEEHVSYFTPETFRFSLARAGLNVLQLQRPTPSLVAITRPQQCGTDRAIFPQNLLAKERQRLLDFASSLPKRRQQVAALLARTRANEGQIAFFGAGHLTCTYINLLQLNDYVEFVMDDHPKKRGLFMPGSLLPIYGSAALLDGNIKLCLSSLSPDSETKVIEKNQQFLSKGGRFASIFPGKLNSLKFCG